jgi:flagella basal body P-ring formation protein FlgA
MVELIPDVQTGDKIDALYSKNSVNITFPVTARTEGVSGDMIRVKNGENQIFEARILNNSTVKIIE